MGAARMILVGVVVALISVVPVGASEGPAEGVDSGWMARVQAGIRDHEYLFERGPASYRPELGDVWQAPNRALDLRLYLDDEGVEILDRSAEDAPTVVRLALAGWGRGEELDRRPAGALREDAGRVERLRGGLIETYANSAAGLDLGWEIDATPAGEGPLVLVIDIEHASARPRGGGVEIVSENGRRLLLQAAQAHDHEGRTLPAKLVVTGRNRLELRVEDGQLFDPLRIKTLLTGVADHVLESNQADANFGCAVSTAGDVNGDGYADVIVGASWYDHVNYDEGGLVVVFLGSAAGIMGTGPADAHAYIWANHTAGRLGNSVSTAGDVNGDGYADIIIGMSDYGVEEGRVFVFHGSAAGITALTIQNADATIPGLQEYAELGWAVSTAGDVNGDGYADIIVGARRHDSNSFIYDADGAAFVLLGSATGITSGTTFAHAQIFGLQDDAELGSAVSTAGDVNGDGYDDIIIGAWRYDTGETDEGAAFVFLGSAAGITGTSPADAHAQLEANQAAAYMGNSVASAGDVDGDGYADIIIGAYRYDNDETDEGAAFVFLGSAAGITGTGPADAHVQLEANQVDAKMAVSVSSAGDVNGDGYADVIVGSDYYDNGETREGAAFVFLGSSAGVTGTGPADAHVQLEANQNLAHMGNSVSSAGDVDGDGYADLIVGAHAFANGEDDEGVAFVFLGSAEGITGAGPADSHSQLEANQGGARMGTSVAAAGDVNGDGYTDVVVGAQSYDNGETDEGAAFVFLGSAVGITGTSPADAHAQIEANQAEALMGNSVATAGDVNGDGYADIIVGAPFYDNGETDEGAALVFLGSATGITGTGPADAHAQLEANQSTAYMGNSVATAGDVNGDGYADIIVGARWYDHGETDEGAAFVFLGSAAGITGSGPADADAQLESNQPDARMAISVASAGDVNGDGYADVIVGSHWYDNGHTDEGAAFVFLGSAVGITGTGPSDAHAQLEANQADAYLGVSVSSAGDVNGDGFADVIAGSHWYDNLETNEGAAFVFLGSAAGITGTSPADAHAHLEANQMGALMGINVATAGDVNGDGFADIIVGSRLYDNVETDEGAAFVFLGSPVGITGSGPADADARLEANQASAELGWSVATAGDVNGDGFGDVIVGARLYDNGHSNEGAAFVFLGNSEGRLVLARQHDGVSGDAVVQPWGASVVEDGFGVKMNASSPRGRELVKLQVEACPSGVPFGSPSCPDWSSSGWADTGTSPEGVELEVFTTGLDPELYRWRARTLYLPFSGDQPGISPPPVPAAGPWRRLGAQSMEADIRVTSECDLTITVDDGQSAAVPGEAVSYAITVSNPGTSAVAGAVVTDNLPAAVSTAYWSCIGSGGGACTASGSGDIDDLADLPVGASVTYTLDVTIDPSATGTLSNSASVSPPAGYVDTNPGDNTDTDIDTLTPEVDLAITKDDGRSHVVAGLGTTYTIVASNPGPSSVFGATVADVFPTELTGASWTCVGAGGGACTASGTGDIDDSVDLYAGGSVTYTTYASVDSGATGTVVNTATVSVPGGVTERDPVDNTDTDTDTIVVPLFADGFESGDTGRWSSATP